MSRPDRTISDRRRDEALLVGNYTALTRSVEHAPLTDVLDAVAAMVEAQSTEAARASILLVSEDGQSLRHGSAPSLPPAYNDAIDGIVIGPTAGSCGTAAHRREQVIVTDTSRDPLWEDFREVAEAAELAACWSTPIFAADGELLATFATYYSEPRSPGPDDQQLIERVTRTIAVAIQHERSRRLLHTAVTNAEAAAARSRRLQALAAQLSAALGPEQVARISADYAMEALGAQAGWLGLLGSDGAYLELVYTLGLPASATDRLSRVPSDAWPALADVVRTGTSWWRSDQAEVLAEFPLLAEAYPGVGSLALLPLRTGGRTIGVLALCRDRPGAFDEDERGEAMAVAAQCGQAVQRAVRFETGQQLAETLQRSLLTDPPEREGLSVAVRYHPATSAAEVGGDWYDAFVLPDGCLALAIGDVVGHDLSAVATMGQLRNMLRALACDGGGDPADVLTRLDRLTTQLAVTDFTSLTFAKVEGPVEGGRTLRWANAGHPPPILMLSDGTARVLDDTGGLVLGVDADSDRTDVVTTLPGGSTLLFYTDGLVETRRDAFDERVALLSDHLAAHAAAPLEDFCDAVLDFVHEPTDDVALLAVRIYARDGCVRGG